jgi:hypothetical protein
LLLRAGSPGANKITDFPSELAVSPIRALRRRNSIPFKDEMKQKNNAWHRAVLDGQALELRTWQRITKQIRHD